MRFLPRLRRQDEELLIAPPLSEIVAGYLNEAAQIIPDSGYGNFDEQKRHLDYFVARVAPQEAPQVEAWLVANPMLDVVSPMLDYAPGRSPSELSEILWFQLRREGSPLAARYSGKEDFLSAVGAGELRWSELGHDPRAHTGIRALLGGEVDPADGIDVMRHVARNRTAGLCDAARRHLADERHRVAERERMAQRSGGSALAAGEPEVVEITEDASSDLVRAPAFRRSSGRAARG